MDYRPVGLLSPVALCCVRSARAPVGLSVSRSLCLDLSRELCQGRTAAQQGFASLPGVLKISPQGAYRPCCGDVHGQYVHRERISMKTLHEGLEKLHYPEVLQRLERLCDPGRL